MRMPRFTAGASLYRSGHYRTGTSWTSPAAGYVQRVTPQNGCDTGYWCCLTASGLRCVQCPIRDPIFGKCLTPAAVTCAGVLGIPADGCSG